MEKYNPKKVLIKCSIKEIYKKIQLLVNVCEKEFPLERIFLPLGIISVVPEFKYRADVSNFLFYHMIKFKDKTYNISSLETPAFKDF